MNMNTLTPEQIKSLKLFAYYCQGYGADEVTQYQYMSNCEELDYYDQSWQKEYGSTISGYDAINSTIQEIIDDNVLTSEGDDRDCDNNGQLKISIDCKERNITINVEENRVENNEMVTEFDGIEDEDVLKLFEHMNESNFSEGVVEFDGGGDSGEIQDKILFDGDIEEEISAGVSDFLYRELENFYGGWEINEGSHGQFIFRKSGVIELVFNEHREDSVDLGRVFYSEF